MFRVYDARQNKKYQSGEMTEKEVFEDFLKNFEPYDEKDGKVSDYLLISTTSCRLRPPTRVLQASLSFLLS